MLLDFAVDKGFDMLAEQRQPLIGRTVFDAPMREIAGPFLEDTGPTQYGQDNSEKFTRQLDIPTALGLDLTDKGSRGVYEAVSSRVVPTIIDTKTIDANPTDATLLNNPAVEGLQTIRLGGSPLGANFAGTSAIASGNDPAAFFSSQPTVPGQETAAPVEPDPAAKQSWFDWLTTTPGGNSLKGEMIVAVIGIGILLVGIFALTR